MPWPAGLWLVCRINLLFLLWRIGMRMLIVRRTYGWGQALLSVPRMVVGNVIAMMAAWRAVLRYSRSRRGACEGWGKTDHSFPSVLPAE